MSESILTVTADRAYNPDRPYWLYRYYDGDGVLIYMGIAREPLKRIRSHVTQPWFLYVDRIEVGESRAARVEAEAIEREAIKTERPLFNRIHADAEQLLTAVYYVRAKGDDAHPYEQYLCSVLTGHQHSRSISTRAQVESLTAAYEKGPLAVAQWKFAQARRTRAQRMEDLDTARRESMSRPTRYAREELRAARTAKPDTEETP